ncbi:MAG: hypothetical protein ACJ76Y_09455 [Thermoanaerobaculia bacterium]
MIYIRPPLWEWKANSFTTRMCDRRPREAHRLAQLGSTHLNLWRALRALVIMALLGAGAAAAQTSLVTAVRDGGGNLKLISWNDNGIRLNAEGASAGAVSLISAARLGNSEQMATAVRDGDGNLKVIVWRVPFNGQIERRTSGQAGAVSRISAASNPTGDRLVTAVRDGSGNLKVIVWAVTPQGSISRLPGDGLAGAVSITLGALPLDHVISATFVGSSGTLLATAVRDGGGNLKIITWRIASSGQVTRLKDISAGAVSEISAIALGTRLVTAVSDGGGNLKLIAWGVDANGGITRGDDAQAGAATQITTFPLSGPQLVTAVRDGGGNLKVISWKVPPSPQEIVRVDDESAGAVSRIAASVCGAAPPGTLTFQTSVRDGGGDLKIITWRTPLGANPITRFPPGSASAGAVSLISTVCFS